MVKPQPKNVEEYDTSEAEKPFVAPERPKGMKRGKSVNLPFFSLSHTPHMFIKVIGPFEAVEAKGLSRGEDGKVTVLPVINLDTGEEGRLLALTVLESSLRRLEENYVGQSFEVVASKPRAGKEYADVKIYVLETE